MKRGPVIVLGILTAAKIHPECSKQVSMVQSNMPQGTDPRKLGMWWLRLLSLSCQTWRMERLEALVDVFNVGSQRGGNSRQVWSSSDPHLSFP